MLYSPPPIWYYLLLFSISFMQNNTSPLHGLISTQLYNTPNGHILFPPSCYILGVIPTSHQWVLYCYIKHDPRFQMGEALQLPLRSFWRDKSVLLGSQIYPSLPSHLFNIGTYINYKHWWIFFHQQNSLFRYFRRFFARWGLFFARWGLFFASLYVSNSPAIMFNLGPPSAPIRQCCFPLQKLKLLTLSAQQECNRWQILTVVCSGGTLSSPAPFQVDDRRSCNGWHGRAARQSPVRTPVTDHFRAQTAKSNLKLCCEADCTFVGRAWILCRIHHEAHWHGMMGCPRVETALQCTDSW